MIENQVIFFRDQDITREQHKDFARRFGPLHVQRVTVKGDSEPFYRPN